VAGKRKVFEKALREGHNFAWDSNWDEAIAAYQRALKEFPADATARNNLAQAYVASGDLDKALAEYQEISRIMPADPLPMTRAAEIHAKRGEVREAVERFTLAASFHESAGGYVRAIELLEQAVELSPDRLTTHERLATLYLQIGKRNAAVEQHLSQAGIYQGRAQPEKAVQQIQAALKINPRSLEARQALEGLRHGTLPAAGEQLHKDEAKSEDEGNANPANSARGRALSELAMAVFEREDESPAGGQQASDFANQTKINTMIGQAIDFQTRDLADDAISSYVTALGLGAASRAIHLNLGLLYQEKQQFSEAIEQLTESLSDEQFALGGHFALGECYRAQGQIDAALKHFIEMLRIVELQHARASQVDGLVQTYETLADRFLVEGDQDKALVFISSLVDFFSSRDWEEKVAEARRRLDSLSENGFVTTLAELLEVPNSDAVLSAMGLSQKYMKQKMYLTASEECFHAMILAPTYLPLHLRLGEILALQGDTDDAVTKYLMVADTYLGRGERRQAMDVYRHVLKFSPMDIRVRSRRIDLLKDFGQIDAALEEYLVMADTYYHMAQIDKAVETYETALQLVPRSADRVLWEPRILHLLADIYTQSVEWVKARKACQRILAVTPADTQARQQLIDLSLKLEDHSRGIQELDESLRQYHSEGADEAAVDLLRELVQSWPKVIELRSRLAQLCLALDRQEDAIEALNALGELQLDAGLHSEAAETVRKLAELEPEKAEDYQKFLDQLRN